MAGSTDTARHVPTTRPERDRRDRRILDLWNTGAWTPAEIAAEVSCSERTVYRVLARAKDHTCTCPVCGVAHEPA